MLALRSGGRRWESGALADGLPADRAVGGLEGAVDRVARESAFEVPDRGGGDEVERDTGTGRMEIRKLRRVSAEADVDAGEA
jgi:hypothetical protein